MVLAKSKSSPIAYGCRSRLDIALSLLHNEKSPFREILHGNLSTSQGFDSGSPTGNRTPTFGLRIRWTSRYPMGPDENNNIMGSGFCKAPDLPHNRSIINDKWISVSTNAKICAKSESLILPDSLKRDQISQQLQTFGD